MNNQRKRLWKASGGRCHWCSRVTRLLAGVPDRISQPPDLATVDHVRSRFVRAPGEASPLVLACYTCNQRRARDEERALLRSAAVEDATRAHHRQVRRQRWPVPITETWKRLE